MAQRRRRRRPKRPVDPWTAQHGPDPLEADEAHPEPPPRGPHDVSDVPEVEGRLDLGGMRIPGVEGMELRVEVSDERIVAATVVLRGSALQLQPFAAPKSTGIWDEVRREIAAGITRQGGTVDETDGPFGKELRAHVPVKMADGTHRPQPARFLGYDGPRWFLRGVITGPAVQDPAAATPLEHVFSHVVVVRGGEPMPPREPILLRLPEQPTTGEAPQTEESGDSPLDPFQRGPEITEVR